MNTNTNATLSPSELSPTSGASNTKRPFTLRTLVKQIDWRQYRSVIALLLIAALLAYLTDGTFVTPRNLTNLARQVAINGILAVGMTYVILIGGIDLSVGSVVALAGVVAGLCQVNLGLAQWAGGAAILGTLLSVIAAVVVGLAAGAFNGFMITRHRIAPFIITLGMMVIARGFALIFAKGAAIAPMSEQFNFIGQGYLEPSMTLGLLGLAGAFMAIRFGVAFVRSRPDGGAKPQFAAGVGGLLTCAAAAWIFTSYRGLPYPVLVFALLGLVGTVALNRTRLGRFVLAIGGNAEAAWLAGVPIQKITFGIYLTIGGLAGLSGAILASRLNGALPTAGELFELDAIAAVVIGGTSLLGGIGSVRGSILGAFFIGTLNNGMSLMDVSEFYQKVIKGVIIILAVWFDMRQTRAKASP